MGERDWLDVSIIRCPWRGRYSADASWYVVELEFRISEKGKTLEAKLTEHI